MEWETLLPSSQFIYEGVTSEEIAAITQDHYFTEVNGIKTIGINSEVLELAAKQYTIPVVEQFLEPST